MAGAHLYEQCCSNVDWIKNNIGNSCYSICQRAMSVGQLNALNIFTKMDILGMNACAQQQPMVDILSVSDIPVKMGAGTGKLLNKLMFNFYTQKGLT